MIGSRSLGVLFYTPRSVAAYGSFSDLCNSLSEDFFSHFDISCRYITPASKLDHLELSMV
eukprot:scaffold3966_cov144-Skeletonema_marinoi.AAC.1